MKIVRILTNHETYFYLLILFLPTQLARHFWPPWSLINGIRLDLFSPTLYFTDILLLLTIFLWVFKSSEIRKFKIDSKFEIRNLKFFLIVFSVVFALLNIVLSLSPTLTLFKWLKVAEFALFAIYVAKTFTVSKFHTSCVLLLISCAYESFIAVSEFILQRSLGGPFWFLGERTFNSSTPGIAQATLNGSLSLRPYATLPHPNALGGYLLIAFILSLHSNISSRLLQVLVGLPILLAIFLTFSRSTYLASVLISFVFITKKSTKEIITKIRIKNISLFGLWNNISFVLGVLLITTGIGLYLVSAPFSDPNSLDKRTLLNQVAIDSLRTSRLSPLIGIGLGNFPILLKDQPTHFPTRLLQPAHNIYLLILSETGALGLLLFLTLLLFSAKKIFKKTKEAKSSFHVQLLTAFFTILFLGLFDHYFLTLQQTQITLALVIGLIWCDNI